MSEGRGAVTQRPRQAAIDALHEHGPVLLATARIITRDEDEAKDLVQMTFEIALHRIDSLREPAALRAWLLRIETREAFRVTRRLRRLVRLDGHVQELVAPGPDVGYRAEIGDALMALPTRTRAAVALHYLAGLSVRETADALGVSENTVKTQIKTGWSGFVRCWAMVEPAESAVEARLREFLAGELHRAEVDYPHVVVARRPGRRAWRSLVMGVVVVGVVAALILVRPSVAPPATSTGDVPTASTAGPTPSPTSEPCMTALAEGTLVPKRGTLDLQSTTGQTLAISWESGYTVRQDGGVLVVIDPLGKIVARQGDFVRVGGGFGNGVFHACGGIAPIPSSAIESPGPGTIIDGFKIGVAETCSPPIGSIDPSLVGSSCTGQPALALAALDARDPGHAAVISTAMYSDGTQPEPVDVTGNAPTPTPPPTAHPGPLVTIFVFTLADGSVRATGVACPDPRSCIGVGSYPN